MANKQNKEANEQLQTLVDCSRKFIVSELTDTDGLTEAERKQLWAILDHALTLDAESLMRAIAEAVVVMNPPKPTDYRIPFDGGV